MKKTVLGILMPFLALVACGQEGPGASAAYRQMLRALYRNTVPTVAPAELVKELKRKPQAVQLLDARAPEEYRVSHLAGARFVNYSTLETQTFADRRRKRPGLPGHRLPVPERASEYHDRNRQDISVA